MDISICEAGAIFILASGQEKLPVEEPMNADASAQYGFTRGADYYGGRDK